MIDNDKAKKAIIDWSKNLMYSKTEMEFFDHCGHIGNFSRNEVITFYAGYAARDKEAEDEKRELVECLINAYKEKNIIVEKYVDENFGYAPPDDPYFDMAIETRDYYQRLIEKHTGKTIDEVIK